MTDLLRSWMPHAACFSWSLWLMVPLVVGGLGTALAYAKISWRVHRVGAALDLTGAARRIAYLFSAFVAACGIGHAIGVWVLWSGAYGVQAIWGLVTAGVSIVTAFKLRDLLKRAAREQHVVAVPATVAEELPRGADGDPTALQRLLSELEVEANDVFATLGIALSITSPTGAVLYASPLMSEVFGRNLTPDMPTEDWVDEYKPFRTDRVTPLRLEEIPTVAALQSGQRVAQPQSNLRPDGTWSDMYLAAAPLRNAAGETVAVVNTAVPMVHALTEGQSALLGALERLMHHG